MAEDNDQESKTEDPTTKRLQDARDKGQVPNSREVGTALLFLAAVGVFYFEGATLWLAMKEKMAFLLGGQIAHDLTRDGVIVLMRELVFGVFADLMPFFVVFVLAALGGSLLQHGGVFTFETILPKFSKVNPIQGFSRLFSMRSLVELFKSIGKMVIIGFAVYLGLEKSIPEVVGLLDHDIPRIIAFLAETSLGVMWRVALAFTGIALLDFIYQQYEHLKGLRMTKQEIKDELKQMEGDPLLKGRIRQIQREMAQRRMMQEVPKADVVITNPTHVAVALKYTPGKMSAPAVVAKGAGLIAARIREVAREHTVPLVENPPLARTLYREVDLNHTIPPALFKAVAEVLAYVFNLKGRRVR